MSKKSDHIETSQNPVDFEDWPEELVKEMRQSHNNGCVGSVLVSETSEVRVWHLRLPPGYRCPFPQTCKSLFFGALIMMDELEIIFPLGLLKEVNHFAGETRHFYYGEDEYMLHSVENIGETELLFTTVEFINGENAPLDIPDSYRLKEPSI